MNLRRFLLLPALFVAIISAALAAWLYQPDIPLEQLLPRYSNDTSRLLPLDADTTVHVRVEGDTFKPPLVLIHGSTASLHTWEPWVVELKSSFRLISLDLPGHGLTGPSHRQNYSIEGMARILHRLLAELEIDAVGLVGSSLGGAVAATFAARYPDQAFALVLIGSAGLQNRTPGSTDEPWDYRLARTPLLQPVVRHFAARPLIRSRLRAVFAEPNRVTEAMVDRYYDLLLRAGNRHALIERVNIPESPERLRRRLADITVPTLILWGENDTRIPVSFAAEFEQAIAGATVIRYPDVGHVVMEEAPIQSAQDVRQFMREQVFR